MALADYWERRSQDIYTKAGGSPGTSELIAELHPAKIEAVEAVVNAHNEAIKAIIFAAT